MRLSFSASLWWPADRPPPPPRDDPERDDMLDNVGDRVRVSPTEVLQVFKCGDGVANTYDARRPPCSDLQSCLRGNKHSIDDSGDRTEESDKTTYSVPFNCGGGEWRRWVIACGTTVVGGCGGEVCLVPGGIYAMVWPRNQCDNAARSSLPKAITRRRRLVALISYGRPFFIFFSQHFYHLSPM